MRLHKLWAFQTITAKEMEDLQQEREILLTALNNWVSVASGKAHVELELDVEDYEDAWFVRSNPSSMLQRMADELLTTGGNVETTRAGKPHAPSQSQYESPFPVPFKQAEKDCNSLWRLFARQHLLLESAPLRMATVLQAHRAPHSSWCDGLGCAFDAFVGHKLRGIHGELIRVCLDGLSDVQVYATECLGACCELCVCLSRCVPTRRLNPTLDDAMLMNVCCFPGR